MTTHVRAGACVLATAAVLVAAPVELARPAPAKAAVAVAAASNAHLSRAGVTRRLRLHAWRYAARQHRKPYVWGGTGPGGFDCSGLVYRSYRSRGIKLPRTTYAMLDSGKLIRIRKSRARRGDLAFFGTGHVELYDHGKWTYGALQPGTRIGYHRMSRFWHPTMYFRVRRKG